MSGRSGTNDAAVRPPWVAPLALVLAIGSLPVAWWVLRSAAETHVEFAEYCRVVYSSGWPAGSAEVSLLIVALPLVAALLWVRDNRSSAYVAIALTGLMLMLAGSGLLSKRTESVYLPPLGSGGGGMGTVTVGVAVQWPTIVAGAAAIGIAVVGVVRHHNDPDRDRAPGSAIVAWAAAAGAIVLTVAFTVGDGVSCTGVPFAHGRPVRHHGWRRRASDRGQGT